MVGEGPLEEEIKGKVCEAGLEKKVLFLGARRDVAELYSAADMFVFPSLHEGLGIVVIEAQASGLPCIVSDAVPQEADMEVGLLHMLRLQDGCERWAESINKNRQRVESRTNSKEKILTGKYNIRLIAEEMQEFYLKQGEV